MAFMVKGDEVAAERGSAGIVAGVVCGGDEGQGGENEGGGDHDGAWWKGPGGLWWD